MNGEGECEHEEGGFGCWGGNGFSEQGTGGGIFLKDDSYD